jgi:hypothetical protein
MVVGGIQTRDKPGANEYEVAELQDDLDALQETVNYHADERSRVLGDTYYVGGVYGDGHYGYDHSSTGRVRQQMAQTDMVDRYSTQLAIKKRKLNDLQHAAEEPQQIIHGHDGEVLFTLRTKRNLSNDLKNISIGDTVTWRGERVSADGDSEIWMISWIEKIDG